MVSEGSPMRLALIAPAFVYFLLLDRFVDYWCLECRVCLFFVFSQQVVGFWCLPRMQSVTVDWMTLG